MSDSSDYVKWFRNSAPYINAHRGRTFVLMFPGEAILDANFANIVHDIALLNSLGVKLVLVHGARAQIDLRLEQRGHRSAVHRDLRITDEVTLACVKDAAGSLRAQIEALLSTGLANSPMHGAQIRVVSGNFVIARPIGILDGIDLGHTGEVRRVDVDGLRQQLNAGNIVLLPNIGYSPTGEVFNLAYEDVAGQVARALAADKLIALTDSPGLMDRDTLLRECPYRELQRRLPATEPVLRRQLDALALALQGDVQRAHLISYQDDGALLRELFTRDGAGTLVSRDQYESIRTATIEDVGGILELIQPLETEGVLVKRSRELLETEIGHFTVMERDGMVVACAALYPYPEDNCGEIACVVTHADYRRSDRGERLLAALERSARQQGLQCVFVLTTRTAHWFQEHGFVPAGLEQLPLKKQQLYNYQRGSRVFMKSLDAIAR